MTLSALGQDEKIRALVIAGKSRSEIASALGFTYEATCERLRKLDLFIPRATRGRGLYARQELARNPIKKRQCLCCRTTFLSDGAHNRVCGGCKKSRSWRDGDFNPDLKISAP